MNPDPTPVDGTENGLTAPAAAWLVIVTTAGLTLAATWTIASELLSWTTVWPVADAGVLPVAPIGAASAAGRTSATVASDATDAEMTDAPIAAASSNRNRGGRGGRWRVVDGSKSRWLGMAGGSGLTSVGRGNV